MTAGEAIGAPIWAILPVKQIGSAKQRLRDVLSGTERRELVRHMLDDVLAAIRGASKLGGTLLVTRDKDVCALAGGIGAKVLELPSDSGQSAAVTAATTVLAGAGIGNIVTIPADVPLTTAAEIDAVCSSMAAAPAVTIVPNRDDTGSNSIAASPPAAIPFSFGPMSFRRHLRACRDQGIEPEVLRLDGLAFDVDVAADIVELLDRETTTATQHYLRDSGIGQRLAGKGAASSPTAAALMAS